MPSKGPSYCPLIDELAKVGMSLLELFPGAGWEAIQWEPEMFLLWGLGLTHRPLSSSLLWFIFKNLIIVR